MQNKKKQIKKSNKKNQSTHQNKKKFQNKDKFSKNQPAAVGPASNEQQKKIIHKNDVITKTINKNIQKTIMERALIAKEKFTFLKPGEWQILFGIIFKIDVSNLKKYLTKINQQLLHVLSLSKLLKPKLSAPSKSVASNEKFSKAMNDIHNTLLYIQTLIPVSHEDKQNNSENSNTIPPVTLHKIFGFTSQSSCKIQKCEVESEYMSSQQKSICEASRRGPYRSYSIAQKLQVLQLHGRGQTFASISRRFSIPQKNIVRWCRNGPQRKAGAGRKVNDVAMQERLATWIKDHFVRGQSLPKSSIRKVAQQFSNKQEFKSSKGWLKNFINRYRLSSIYSIE